MNQNKNEQVVAEINTFVKSQPFFDMCMYSFKGTTLEIAGSVDLTYYHSLTIIFKMVFFVGIAVDWKVDEKIDSLSIVTGDEARQINIRHRVIVGNTIFKFIDEDQAEHLIIAEEIGYKKELVKYY